MIYTGTGGGGDCGWNTTFVMLLYCPFAELAELMQLCTPITVLIDIKLISYLTRTTFRGNRHILRDLNFAIQQQKNSTGTKFVQF